MGLGIILMNKIEEYYKDVVKINLDTPVWNIRTNSFYKKCGYIETKKDEEMVYYEKSIKI